MCPVLCQSLDRQTLLSSSCCDIMCWGKEHLFTCIIFKTYQSMCHALCQVFHMYNFSEPSGHPFVEVENGGLLRLRNQVQTQAVWLQRPKFLITMLSCIWQKYLWMFGLSSFASSLSTKASQIINSSSFSSHKTQCTPRVFNTSSVEIKVTFQPSQWVPGCLQWPCEAGTPIEGQHSYRICQVIQAKPKWLPKKTHSPLG